MATGNRIQINLACEECGERNYRTEKNEQNTPQKLTLRKFCPRCREVTDHEESK